MRRLFPVFLAFAILILTGLVCITASACDNYGGGGGSVLLLQTPTYHVQAFTARQHLYAAGLQQVVGTKYFVSQPLVNEPQAVFFTNGNQVYRQRIKQTPLQLRRQVIRQRTVVRPERTGIGRLIFGR